MRVQDTRTGTEWIGVEECRRLLASAEVGRIGFVNGDVLEIMPVTYALDGDAVVFATANGTKLWAVTRGPVVFEVDQLDAETRCGWSVVVRGLAQELTAVDSPAALRRVRDLAIHPWAGGFKPYLIRIVPQTLTGRRVAPQLPAEDWSTAATSR